MDLINKGWYGMFSACEVWCIADISSVSRPSSEQTAVDKMLTYDKKFLKKSSKNELIFL